MIVFDASTLILLAKVELLRRVVEAVEVMIPPVVESESTRKDTLDAGLIRTLIMEGKVKVKRVKEPGLVKRLMEDFRLDEGEAEALDMARGELAILATDDGPTIKGCKVLGVEFATALHFLIRARERGVVDTEIALAKLEKLKAYGRYEPRIIEDARHRLMGGE